MKIQHVPLEFVNQTWGLIEDFIKAAVDQQEGEPDYTIDQVRALVASGQWMLLVAVADDGLLKGAATVNFFNRPNHRVAYITYIGGRLVSNPGTFEQMCAIFKQFGATAIEGAVNEAVSRLWRRYGFTEKYRVAGVKI